MSQTFHCPNCGAPLDFPGGDQSTVRCPFCNSSVIIPPELRDKPLAETVLGAADALHHLPGLAKTMREVVQLTHTGQKVEAIQLLHEHFSIGVAEAKQIVEQIERGEVVQLTHLIENAHQGIIVGQGNTQDIVNLVQSGNKIEAIRIFRERFGVSLAGAKSAVDAIEVGLNELSDPEPVSRPSFTPSPALSQSANVELDRWRKQRSRRTGLIVVFAAIILLGVVAAIFISNGSLAGIFAPRPADTASKLLLSFGEKGTGEGYFDDPRSIAVADNGDLYIADYQDGRVQHFDSNGNYQNLWNVGTDLIVQALETGPGGTVFVVANGEVHYYDGTSGGLLGTYPLPDGNFYQDIRAAPDGGFLALASGETLIRVNTAGQVLWTLDDAISAISGDAELDSHIALDGLGNVYVAGSFNDAVFKYSSDGKFLTQWGQSGDAEGQFQAILAIGVDNQSRVYVSDVKGVQVFDSSGRFLQTIDVAGAVFAIDFDRQGNIFLVTNTPRILEYSPLPVEP